MEMEATTKVQTYFSLHSAENRINPSETIQLLCHLDNQDIALCSHSIGGPRRDTCRQSLASAVRMWTILHSSGVSRRRLVVVLLRFVNQLPIDVGTCRHPNQ